MPGYEYQRFPYRRPAELDGRPAGHGEPPHPVVIVGAGPVGLAAAIDLATRGVPSVVLDDNDVVSVGSRAICWAKRTLEIFDRLGVGGRMVAKGVTWKLGRFYEGDRELYSFDLLPESGHRMPAFINLQQYYVEHYLVDRAMEFPGLIDLRWKNRVANIRQKPDGATLDVETPDGTYVCEAAWVLAADGARSPLRTMLGLSFEGQVFEEQFLIVDVRLAVERPNERHFWFHPVFDRGDSVLLHRQPDNVYRIDFQLGPDADAEGERSPERIRERVAAVFGPDTAYELEWSSVYRFRCARLERFVHGRVVFVGDSAHVVSPFGARGGNGGIQDVDNLCWKLALVVRGEAPSALVGTYDEERGHGADENILNSARTTRFMTPRTSAERAFRDGVLTLARDHAFARRLVNGGRLSRPCSLAGLDLQTADAELWQGGLPPGSPCLDAPVEDPAGRPGWLLSALGSGFTLLVFASAPADVPPGCPAGADMLVVSPRPLPGLAVPVLVDREGLAAVRYGAAPGAAYLVRPDGHVAARFRSCRPDAVDHALRRAVAMAPGRDAVAA